jgi:hypothetical protein
MENIERSLLRLAVQVNHQVPARYEIQARERRVFEKIVRGKKDHLAHLAPYTVATMFLLEKAPQSLLAHVGGDRLRVNSDARHLDRRIIEITAENLNRRRRIERARVLQRRPSPKAAGR